MIRTLSLIDVRDAFGCHAGRLRKRRGSPEYAPERLSAQVDELIFDLIDERRREAADGEDILALLLAATHDDGSPMSPEE